MIKKIVLIIFILSSQNLQAESVSKKIKNSIVDEVFAEVSSFFVGLPGAKQLIAKIEENRYKMVVSDLSVSNNITKSNFQLTNFKEAKEATLIPNGQRVGYIVSRYSEVPYGSYLLIVTPQNKKHETIYASLTINQKEQKQALTFDLKTQKTSTTQSAKKAKSTSTNVATSSAKNSASRTIKIDKHNWNRVPMLPGDDFSFSKLNIRQSYGDLIHAARQGNKEAKVQVGLMYLYGKGIKQDVEKSLYWFKASAKDKHPQGQKMLAHNYWAIQGKPDDYQAFKYFRLSAQQGDLEAQVHTADFYQRGIGVALNKSKAFFWYKKAAQQGDAYAMGFLGLKLKTGSGVTKNDTEALYWFKKSASKGDADSQYVLGRIYASGDGVSQDLSKARNLLSKSANQGNTKAAAFLKKYF